MTTTAVVEPPTPHDLHHRVLTEAEKIADHLTPTMLYLIRSAHRRRFPTCPAASLSPDGRG